MYLGVLKTDKIFKSKTEALENLPLYRNHCPVDILLRADELPKSYNKHIICCEACSKADKAIREYGGLKKYREDYGPKSDTYKTSVQIGDIRSLAFTSICDITSASERVFPGEAFYTAPEVCVLDIDPVADRVLVAYTFPINFRALVDKGDVFISDIKYYIETWNTMIIPTRALTDFTVEWDGAVPQVYLPKAISKKCIKTLIEQTKKKPPIITNDIVLQFRALETKHRDKMCNQCNFYYKEKKEQ